MKYLRTDRVGLVLEVVDVEIDPETGSYPPLPAGWTLEPWNSFGEIFVGDWARYNNYQPAGALDWAALTRDYRNAELAACDWTQTQDQPTGRAALWAPYRQLLRDVPQQLTFGDLVADWPERPE